MTIYHWYLGALASVGFASVIAALIHSYAWRNDLLTTLKSIKGNDLSHIQKATEDTATGVHEVKEALIRHDTTEKLHHEAVTKVLDKLL